MLVKLDQVLLKECHSIHSWTTFREQSNPHKTPPSYGFQIWGHTYEWSASSGVAYHGERRGRGSLALLLKTMFFQFFSRVACECVAGIFLWWQLCISWQHGNLAIPRVATGTTDLGLALFGARPSNAAQELICHKLPTISSIFGKSNDKDFVCFSDTSPLSFSPQQQKLISQNFLKMQRQMLLNCRSFCPPLSKATKWLFSPRHSEISPAWPCSLFSMLPMLLSLHWFPLEIFSTLGNDTTVKAVGR